MNDRKMIRVSRSLCCPVCGRADWCLVSADDPPSAAICARVPVLDRLLVAEGPTDAAALLDLGFAAVGRQNCTGGVGLMVELVRRRHEREVVIVADADPPGRRGADNLAAVLVAYVPVVRIIEPPAGVKDARAWKQTGAKAADIESSIYASPIRRLKITTKVVGSGVRCGK